MNDADKNMDFFDVLEHTRYEIRISRPEKMEDLSDLFMTREELEAIIGQRFFYSGTGPRSYTLDNVVTSELNLLVEKLDAGKAKTIRIEDEELLSLLKSGRGRHYVSDFISDTYGRHGDRLCYARRYSRKKTKATQGDVHALWNIFSYAFKRKFDCYPTHVPRRDRNARYFKAWKQILGWRAIRASISNKDHVKFYRQIWDNPEEFML